LRASFIPVGEIGEGLLCPRANFLEFLRPSE